MTDSPILSYTSTRKIPNLPYTGSVKKVPLWAEPPRIGCYLECFPPPPPQWDTLLGIIIHTHTVLPKEIIPIFLSLSTKTFTEIF